MSAESTGATPRLRGAVMSSLYPGALLMAGLAVPLALSTFVTVTTGTVLLLLVGAYSGFRLVVVLFNGRDQVLQLFFWIFSWVFFGLAPVAQLFGGRWPWPGAVTPSVMITICALLLTSFVCYDLGILISWRADTAALAPPRYLLSTRRLRIAAPLAILVCGVEILRVGPGSLLSGRQERAQAVALGATSGLDSVAAAVNAALMVTAVFVVAYLFIRAKRLGLLRGWHLTLLLLIALTLFVSNPTSTARYRVAAVAAGLLLALLWPLGRVRMAYLGIGVLAGIAFLFPALNAFRRVGGTFSIGGSVVSSLQSGDYDAFQQIGNTVLYVQDVGHSYGRQLLTALLFFIPRSVWPGKSLDTGVIVAAHQGYAFTNLSAPLQAEAYIDGGFPLVIVLFVGFGLLTGLFERRTRDASSASSFVALLVPLVAAYQLIVLRGSLLQSMAGLMSLVLFTWLCTERAPSPDPSPGPGGDRRRTTVSA
ncbi:MAG TPA: hypothetical protein VGC45_10355 [Gryllotalpicola sp.]